METVKSLAWVPFGLVLVAGVAFVVVVLLKVVFPRRRKHEGPDDWGTEGNDQNEV